MSKPGEEVDLVYPLSPIPFPILPDIEEGGLLPSLDDVAEPLMYHHQVQHADKEEGHRLFEFELI